MTTTLRSEELKDLLAKVHKQGATGFVSVTVKEGARSVYGTLQVLKGQLLAAQFGGATGQSALEQIATLESPAVSFSRSSVNAKRDVDIPSISDVIGSSQSESKAAKTKAASAQGLSVRNKMLLLFSVLPIVILISLGAFYVSQLRAMSGTLVTESETIVRSLAEDTIQLAANNVAAEASRYLQANPQLTKEQFQTDPVFKQIAQQPVGSTGYTVLLEGPFDPGDRDHAFWVHPNDALVGLDLSALAGPLGDNYPSLKALMDQVTSDLQGGTAGYYAWLEPDGSLRDKYLATTRVEGTSFYIASTTYIDEFTQPMVNLEESSAQIINRTQLFVIIAVVFAILFTLFSVAFYGNRLSKKIQAISDTADAISMGKLDTNIEGTERKDEIGSLARALERLRVSVQVMFNELNSQQGS